MAGRVLEGRAAGLFADRLGGFAAGGDLGHAGLEFRPLRLAGEALVEPGGDGQTEHAVAQEFQPLKEGEESFVAVANHFKSKGSVAKGDADSGDGQGNNPNVRNAQAQAVLDALHKQEDWKDKPLFALGDFNTYTHETALDVFRNDGFTVPAEKYGADTSYQFSGLLGTLDHVLANKVATGTLDDAQVCGENLIWGE